MTKNTFYFIYALSINVFVTKCPNPLTLTSKILENSKNMHMDLDLYDFNPSPQFFKIGF